MQNNMFTGHSVTLMIFEKDTLSTPYQEEPCA
jgi:hypothetical protein